MGYYWIILLLPAFFGSSHGDCGAPPRLDFGELDINLIDQVNFSVGAVVTYSCRPGYVRAPGTKNVTTCLSDSTWSTPETFCNRRSCGYPGDIANGEVSLTDTLFGSMANYTCNLGYRMISRRSFRECRADGIWSNDVPECAVQICPPPDAIIDGKVFPDKEEYQYQDAVIYECNDKTSALIGEKSLYCTASGEWSSDPPECKAVDCLTPNVDNAIKVSGFTGPYGLNSAVTFECLQGYTMDGEPSVKCNASSKWEPSLPTCKTGDNVGVIVGVVIAGIVGIVAAVAVCFYVCRFKKNRGGGYVGPTGKNPDSGTSSSHQRPIEQCDMKQIEAQETH